MAGDGLPGQEGEPPPHLPHRRLRLPELPVGAPAAGDRGHGGRAGRPGEDQQGPQEDHVGLEAAAPRRGPRVLPRPALQAPGHLRRRSRGPVARCSRRGCYSSASIYDTEIGNLSLSFRC